MQIFEEWKDTARDLRRLAKESAGCHTVSVLIGT
jgi:hypothetical protein